MFFSIHPISLRKSSILKTNLSLLSNSGNNSSTCLCSYVSFLRTYLASSSSDRLQVVLLAVKQHLTHRYHDIQLLYSLQRDYVTVLITVIEGNHIKVEFESLFVCHYRLLLLNHNKLYSQDIAYQ